MQILNHSIDVLIGYQDEQTTIRMCHKYGFHNPDDFLLTTRSIAKLYRTICCSDQNGTFDHTTLPSELRSIIPEVLDVRRDEVLRFLIREHNTTEFPLVESFDWDVRLILGDSSFDQNIKQVATLTFRLSAEESIKKDKAQTLHFQIYREKIDEFVNALEVLVNNNKLSND